MHTADTVRCKQSKIAVPSAMAVSTKTKDYNNNNNNFEFGFSRNNSKYISKTKSASKRGKQSSSKKRLSKNGTEISSERSSVPPTQRDSVYQ